METPATKLGVDNSLLDTEFNLGRFANLHKRKTTGEKPWQTAMSLCTAASDLCNLYYLRGDRQNARRWGVELVNSGEYYLFGDWREKAITDEGRVDPDWWFSRSVSWTDQLCDCLCWGAAFGLWEGIDQLMAFPTEKIGKDLEGAVPRAFYIGLARWWTDHADVSWIDDVKSMRGAGSKDYHLRCDVLWAIGVRDESLASKSFTKYLQFWLKRMKDCPQRLPKDAAFLWHVARREGIVLDLSDELLMHVPIVPEED